MKKINLVLISLALSIASCHHTTDTTQNMSLEAQRQIIRKQIDSLQRKLIKIEKKLRDSINPADIPLVRTDTAKLTEFKHYIDVQGSVKSDGNINVIPEFAGEVVKIYKNPGDKVKKGEVIMKIDDKLLRDQIAELRTQYALAKTAYERQARLWKQKIGSEMAYLQAKTKKEALARKLNTLYTRLKKANVKAPISGTVDDIMIKEGEMAGPARPVARIVNLDKVYIEADVSEKYLKNITKGKPVAVEFPTLGVTERAKIDFVGNFIHPNNRTFKIRIYLPGKKGIYKPNLTGKIKIADYTNPKAFVLPVSLVMQDETGKNYVMIAVPAQDKKDTYTVKKRYVETGYTYGDQLEIKSGLQPGDLVIVTGARGLSDGDLVRIQTKTEENE